VSKCTYCDFLSFEHTSIETQENYVAALINEMELTLHELADAVIDTVYIGGGTPTALPAKLLCNILQKVQQFNLSPNSEFTIEINPELKGVSKKHNPITLTQLKSYGINRLSIGLQAWQNDLLKSIKRPHTTHDFINTMQAARAAGFDNINVDLMFALPNQTISHWQESITQVLAHSPEHISAYSLTPAENTPLWESLESGNTILPDDTIDRTMYHEAIVKLKSAGYNHYELSNFAKPGHKSRHNTNCWQRKPYIGLGLGAHSFNGTARWHNTDDMQKYVSAITDIQQHEKSHAIREDFISLTQQDSMSETMFLGLRMTEGVSLHGFFKTFGKSLQDCYGPQLDQAIANGLLTVTDDHVALTPRGLDLANRVFEMFI